MKLNEDRTYCHLGKGLRKDEKRILMKLTLRELVLNFIIIKKRGFTRILSTLIRVVV